MSTKTSYVGFNGTRYDTTGQIINTIRSDNIKTGQVIDGFIKGPQPPPRAARSAELHRRSQRAQTLARSGLKKPAQHFSSRLQKFTAGPDFEREARAKQIKTHARVNRFGGAARSAFKTAQSAPKSLSGEIISRARRPSAAAKPVPAPAPSMVTSVSHQKLERLLDEALVRADAHKAAMQYQAARHFWRRRWLSGPRRWVVMVAFVAALSASLFIAWQKIPQLSLKAASIRAHLHAVAPAYEPEGYRLTGPAKAISGAVSLDYQSGAGGYTINQAASNMTSNMVAHSLIPSGASIQTSQIDGNTIYIYGSDNDAAWVNNGVLYTIKNKSNLGSDELLKIAKGINP